MRKVNFFAILAAAAALTLGVTSCAKENNGGAGGGKGTATLVVKLPSNVVPDTRAVEDPATTGSTTSLKNVTVFLLNGNSVVDHETFATTDISLKYKRLEQVSASVNRVIVVANVPSAGDQTTLEGYNSAAQILSHPYTTASQNTAPGVGEAVLDNKVLVGDAAAAAATDPDTGHDPTHTYKEADVALNSLTARFEIGAVKPGAGIASVELVGMWINKFYNDGSLANVENQPSTANYWNTTPATTPGTNAAIGAVTIPNAWLAPEYFDDADNTNVTVAAASKVYAYQVFAGANIPQVVLLVKGEYDTGYYQADGSDKYFMGYITFSKFDDGGVAIPSVAANTIYKVGVGATGIEIDSEMITTTPNLGQIDLGVKVTVTPWTEKNVTPGV